MPEDTIIDHTIHYELDDEGMETSYETTVNEEYMQNMKDVFSQYMSGDDLGVVMGRYDKIREELEEELDRVEENYGGSAKDAATFVMGVAFGDLVRELSEPSRFEPETKRYSAKVMDNVDSTVDESLFNDGVDSADENSLDEMDGSALRDLINESEVVEALKR